MTFPYNPELPEERNLRLARPDLMMFEFTGEVFAPGQGFNRGRKLFHGEISWHTERYEQGISVRLTGMDCQALRDSAWTEQDYLEFVAKRGGKVSTMHACINVHDAGATTASVIEARDNGTMKTRAKMVGQYSSTTKVKDKWLQGDTVYIGSAKSDIQIRIYNKAVEQRTSGDWLRIEIIWRGRHAQSAHAAMLKSGIGPVTRAAILHQVQISTEWWHYAMSGDTSLPEKVHKRNTGRNTWLKNVVLPALRSEIEEQRRLNYDEIYEIYAGFIDSMKPKTNGVS